MRLYKQSKSRSARVSSKNAPFRPDLESLGQRIIPATHTWVGGNSSWSVGANWTNGVPTTGEPGGTIVVFNTGVTTAMNIPNLRIDELLFDGNAIVQLNLQNDLRITPNLNAIANLAPGGIISGGNLIFSNGAPNATAGIGAANATTLQINANVTGTTNLDIVGGGTGIVDINADLTPSGATRVVNGVLRLSNAGSASPAAITVGDGVGPADSATLSVFDNTSLTSLNVDTDGLVAILAPTTLTVADLTLKGANVSNGKLTLTNSLTTTAAAVTSTISSPTTLSGSFDLNVGTGPAAIDLLFSNTLTGNASVSMTGGGTARLAGTTANTLTGGFTVKGGTLELAKPAGVEAVNSLAIGQSLDPSAVRLINPNQIDDGASVTLLEGALTSFDLNGQDETINDLNIGSGTLVTTGDGDLTVNGVAQITAGDVLMGANGRLKLTNTTTVTGDANDQLMTITGGTLDLNGAAQTLTVLGAANTLELSASLANGSIVKEGAGKIVLQQGGNNASAVRVNAGTVQVNAALTNTSVVLTGGTLQGSGQATGITATGGTIVPGGGFSPLKSASVSANAATTFQVEIFGANDFRQLSATGTVSLGNAILNLTQNAQVPVGTVIPLILNDGTDAILGTFAGRPEGSLIVVNRETFRISYVGGDGNDVTATAVATSNTAVSTSTGVAARSGQNITLTAVVTAAANVSGTVRFLGGNAVLGDANVVVGVASLPANFAEGAHAITAIYSGDADVAASTSAVFKLSVNPELYAVGAGAGGSSAVSLINADGTTRATYNPFAANFIGGVRTAAADVNGDGYPDVIAGTVPGVATQVKVLDGKTGAELFVVAPFEAAFTGGVFVAAGDINGDGKAEFAITPDEGGGPRVRLFNGADFTVLADFFGIDDAKFRGGARATFADLNGDGNADLLLSAGFGGGPRVAGFDGAALAQGITTTKLFNDFFAFEQALRNGAYLAGGDLDGDGKAELLAGGGPRVTAFGGAKLLTNEVVPVANFFTGAPNNRGGVPVGAKQLTADGAADILAGAGATGGSKVTAYSGEAVLKGTTDPLHQFDAFPGFLGGVYVG